MSVKGAEDLEQEAMVITHLEDHLEGLLGDNYMADIVLFSDRVGVTVYKILPEVDIVLDRDYGSSVLDRGYELAAEQIRMDVLFS
jgi:hypothetical protein